jgi:ribosomal protein L9
MDLTLYYNNIREEEARIAETFAVIVSNETADGGKAGQLTEAPKAVAARMIIQGLARLATAEQAEAFRADQEAAARQMKEQAAAAQVQFSVMPRAQLEMLKSAAKLKE